MERLTAATGARLKSLEASPALTRSNDRTTAGIEAGALFARIREVSQLSLMEAAQRLHTFPSVIDALESGDFDRLPPWPETVVVVSGFTALAGIDPRPVLTTIREALDAKIIDAQVVDVKPSPAQHPLGKVARQSGSAQARAQTLFEAPARPARARAAVAPASSTVTSSTVTRVPGVVTSETVTTKTVTPRAQRARAVLGTIAQTASIVAMPAAAALRARLASVATATAKLPGVNRLAPRWRLPAGIALLTLLPFGGLVSFGGLSPIQAAASSLPQPLYGLYRSAEDYLLRSTATQKNGLMWIDVHDPRTRKTDKLPSHER